MGRVLHLYTIAGSEDIGASKNDMLTLWNLYSSGRQRKHLQLKKKIFDKNKCYANE